ncbi:MAG: protein kinase [Candidatus Brocadiae bacterium]|nr:protein kinase [Candidatus Brocadiia bacterium]
MQIQSSLGNYEIIEKIGTGGMGVVYKAKDQKLSRIVALKFLHKNLLSTAALKRFQREIEISAQLDHPNIIKVYHFESSAEMPYLVMEYIEGKSFTEYIKSQEYSLEEKLVILQKIGYALQYAHKNKIIHRDVKPANILVRNDGEPALMDFGIAKSTQVSDHSITKSGEVVGTPQYMSPEQAIGVRRNIDHQSDIYALGSILYHILTGHTVVEGDNFFNLLYSLTEEEPIPILSWNPQAPKQLVDVCYKAIEKNKKSRYSQAKTFADDLGKYLKKTRVSAKGFASQKKLKRSARYFSLSVLSIIIVVSCLFFSQYTGKEYDVKIAQKKQIAENQKKIKALLPEIEDLKKEQKWKEATEKLFLLEKQQEEIQAADSRMPLKNNTFTEILECFYQLIEAKETIAPDYVEKYLVPYYNKKKPHPLFPRQEKALQLAILYASEWIGDHRKVLEIANSIQPGEFPSQIDWIIGQAYYESKDFSHAMKFLKNLSVSERQKHQFYLGIIFFERQNFYDAQQQFQKLMEDRTSPFHAKSCLYLCAAYLKQKKEWENPESYIQILEENKKSLEQENSLLYKEVLGSLYLLEGKGRIEKSIDLLRQCALENPLSAEYFKLLSQSYSKLGRHKEASQNILLAAQIQPSDSKIMELQWKYLSEFMDVQEDIFNQIIENLNYIFVDQIDIFEEDIKDLRLSCKELCKQRKIPLDKWDRFYNNLFTENIELEKITQDALLSVRPLEEASDRIKRNLDLETHPAKKIKLQNLLQRIESKKQQEKKIICLERLTSISFYSKIHEVVLQYFEGETERNFLKDIFHKNQESILKELFSDTLQEKHLEKVNFLWQYIRFSAIRVLAFSKHHETREFFAECLEKHYPGYDLETKILFIKALKETGMFYYKPEHRSRFLSDLQQSMENKKFTRFLECLASEILISTDKESQNIIRKIFSLADLKTKLYILSKIPREKDKDFLYNEIKAAIQKGYESSDDSVQALSIKNLDVYYLNYFSDSKPESLKEEIKNYCRKALATASPLVQHVAMNTMIKVREIFLPLENEEKQQFLNLLKGLEKSFHPRISQTSLAVLTMMGDTTAIDKVGFEATEKNILFFRGCSYVRGQNMENLMSPLLKYVIDVKASKENNSTLAGILFYLLCHYREKLLSYKANYKIIIDGWIYKLSNEYISSPIHILTFWCLYGNTRISYVPENIVQKIQNKFWQEDDIDRKSLIWGTLLCIGSKQKHKDFHKWRKWIDLEKDPKKRKAFCLAGIFGYKESIRTSIPELLQIDEDVLQAGKSHIDLLEISEIQKYSWNPDSLNRVLFCYEEILKFFYEIMPLQEKEKRQCSEVLYRMALLYSQIQNRNDKALEILSYKDRYQIQDARLDALEAELLFLAGEKEKSLKIINSYKNLNPHIVRAKARIFPELQKNLYWKQYYLDPSDPVSLISLGKYYLDQKNYAQASEIFQETLYWFPRRSVGEVYYYIAKLSLMQNKPQEAKQNIMHAAHFFYPLLNQKLSHIEWEALGRGTLCFEIASHFAYFDQPQESAFWLKEAKQYNFRLSPQTDTKHFQKYPNHPELQNAWKGLFGKD